MPRQRTSQETTRETHNRGKLDVNATLRAVKAMDLRRMGYNYDEIAARCGYANRSGAYKAIKRELDRTVHESADALRHFQLEQLNAALTVVMEGIAKRDKGSLWAVDRLTPLLKRQAELMGLDTEKRQGDATQMVIVGVAQDIVEAI